jgi:hypothetical protein
VNGNSFCKSVLEIKIWILRQARVGTLFKNRSPRLILALGVLTKHNRITHFPVIFAFLTRSNFVRFLINILRSNLAAVICARGYRYRGGGSPGTPFTLYSHVHEDNEFEARCPLCTTLPVAPYIAYLQYPTHPLFFQPRQRVHAQYLACLSH